MKLILGLKEPEKSDLGGLMIVTEIYFAKLVRNLQKIIIINNFYMRVYNFAGTYNSRAANQYLHYNDAIGSLSHQEKSPG